MGFFILMNEYSVSCIFHRYGNKNWCRTVREIVNMEDVIPFSLNPGRSITLPYLNVEIT